MTSNDRTALRAAVLIHEQFARRSVPDIARCPTEYSWAAAARLRRQIVRARDRGWHQAAWRLLEELGNVLRRCQSELEAALRVIDPTVAPLCIPTPSEIYQDLLALRKEFDDVEIDLADHEIRISTDTIVLEGVDLGRFEIRLDWQRLGAPCTYRVVALDPNPATGNTEVTHPHVQGETLCEGDGRAAIRAALAQGRLYDLFLLVSQLLHTYGQGSAYVELDAWDGITCDDCGSQMQEADRYGCSRCGSSLCDECSRCCAGCDESHCCGCLSTCPDCEQEFCSSCLQTCPRCTRRVCGGCTENDLCATCQQEQSQEEEDNDDDHETNNQGEPTPPEARERVTPAESRCLGETLVPA